MRGEGKSEGKLKKWEIERRKRSEECQKDQDWFASEGKRKE